MKKVSVPRHKRRVLKAHEKLNLPVPRLEIRKYLLPQPVDGYNIRADYSLVYEHLDGSHVLVPLGTTKIGADLLRYDAMDVPFRDGAHMLNDMFVMKLRGFIVYGSRSQEILLTKDTCPNALLAKMKKLGLEPAD